MYFEAHNYLNSKNNKENTASKDLMPIKGVLIFKSDSGITLYSKQNVDVQEDYYSAFLTALKGFFSSLDLGGLSTFSSDNFIFYLASVNNCLTSLMVESDFKSDKYFKLAFEISSQFYLQFKSQVDSKTSIMIKGKEHFDDVLDHLVAKYEHTTESDHQDIISLYNVNNSGDLEPFMYENEEQLRNQDLFLAVNSITKRIFIVENSSKPASSRKLFMAGKSASNLNQKDFKSEYQIRNVSDEFDFERILDMTKKIFNEG